MTTSSYSDIVSPKEFIVPIISGSELAQPQVSGALYLSGAKLYFMFGTPQLITSG